MIIATGGQGEPRAALSRIAEGNHPISLSDGDVVLFSKYGGTEVKVEGQEYLILSARDILAVIG